MKKIIILDAKTLGEDLDLTPLAHFGEVTRYQTTTPKETLGRIQTADIIITNKVIITAQMMEESPKLKLICIAATGMNNVDLDAAKTMGIAVKNVAGYSTDSVVQHTFTMALHLIGRMKYYASTATSGAWSNAQLFTDVSQPFFEISGKKWGIIGLGEIGREVAKVATAFGAKVQYYSTSQNNLEQEYPHLSLDTLLKDSDILSIHAPLNRQTDNLIDSTELKLLKNRAVLLNLGRGGIVNEEALAKELDTREIYAGLDVLVREPIALDNPLMKILHHERLLITPHIAWASVEARQRLLKAIADNIEAFLKGL